MLILLGNNCLLCAKENVLQTLSFICSASEKLILLATFSQESPDPIHIFTPGSCTVQCNLKHCGQCFRLGICFSWCKNETVTGKAVQSMYCFLLSFEETDYYYQQCCSISFYTKEAAGKGFSLTLHCHRRLLDAGSYSKSQNHFIILHSMLTFM